MSKLNNHFDEIAMSEELQKRTLDRIDNAKTAKHKNTASQAVAWYKNKRLWIKGLACALVLAISLPLLLSMPFFNNGNRPRVHPPVLGATHAFAVTDQAHLNSLFEIEEVRPTNGRSPMFACSSADGDNILHGNRPDSDNAVGGNAPPASPPENDRNDGATSETNIQVDGMDEGDIVRNDGNYIYRLSGAGLTIVRTDRGQVYHVLTKHYQNFAPVEMIVQGNIMIILGGTRQGAVPYWMLNEMSHRDLQWINRWHDRVQIRVYDITNRQNPVLTRFLEIDGRFNTSRVRIETGTLFFVADFFASTWTWCYQTHRSTRQIRMPYFRECIDAPLVRFPFDNLFYTVKNKRMRSFMLLGRIDLHDNLASANIRGYLSGGDIISVSTRNLYTATTVWGRERRQWVDRTHISRFCLETLVFSGTAVVLGTPPSRHAIDEHNGYLRVATTYGDWWRSAWDDSVYFASAVFVFDSDLNLVSYILGIAEGETMDSARFNGDFGFISTSPPWLIWDPLYTIDLTNHHNITISEGLETDGINQYLRHVGDTGLAIGIGQDALPEGAALQTGIKIELYDMRIGTGKEPVSLSKYTIYGEWTSAEVLFEPRALLFWFCEDSLIGYVGFSAEAAGMRTVWDNVRFAQGFYLWRINANEGQKGLEFLGDTRLERLARVNAPTPGSQWVWEYVWVEMLLPSFSNFDTSVDVLFDWSNWRQVMQSYIYRAVLNQGYLYTVSDNMIAGYCMVTRQRVGYFAG